MENGIERTASERNKKGMGMKGLREYGEWETELAKAKKEKNKDRTAERKSKGMGRDMNARKIEVGRREVEGKI